MRIGIFSKMNYAGGSEFRCVELANALVKHTEHEACLLAEGRISEKLYERIHKGVKVIPYLLTGDRHAVRPVSMLYDLDSLLVVNTDSREFTRAEYWRGETDRHTTRVELGQMKQMVFVFNFIISPSVHLAEIRKSCPDVRIIATNQKFYEEISEQERYEAIRHYPRIMLESPIDPESITTTKTPSDRIRIGMHSLGLSDKWNQDFPVFVKNLNERFPGKLGFSFMGMPSHLAGALKDIPNVKTHKEFRMPVREFLQEIDIFSFFSSFSREEPWSRAVAEALMAGCPVLATHRGGNPCQILHGNNGCLCRSAQEFVERAAELVQDKAKFAAMRVNAIRMSRWFRSQEVVKRLEAFLRN